MLSTTTTRIFSSFSNKRTAMSSYRHFSSSTPPPPSSSNSWFKRRIALKRIFWATAIAGSGFLGYEVYKARHPSAQLDFDRSKKTLVVLGSGWAATSFLKGLDTLNYNVIVVSPRNYFLFTPLLPSCTVGTVELRSIMQPMRYITRSKDRQVMFIEGDCLSIDPEKKQLMVKDQSELAGEVSEQTLAYDYLVVACGAETATFGIPGVEENSCFLKEIWDARKIRTKLMDCLETAAFPGQPEKEIQRLLHMVVVGGGPTGVEYAAELFDFLNEDLQDWYPDIAGKIKITLIEAMPHVLPMFSKQLIDYTERTFAENKVNIRTNTMVKQVNPRDIVVMNQNKDLETVPYGLLVWAAGNKARPLVVDLIKKLPSEMQTQRRGLVVDDFLRVKGSPDGSIFALGDASATKFAPTAQVANKQGQYLAGLFNSMGYLEVEREAMAAKGVTPEQVMNMHPPFVYEGLGMLAYIGNDKAVADFPGGAHFGGLLTFYFWRSAYLSNLFSWRNKLLVSSDWVKKTVFGRDIGRE